MHIFNSSNFFSAHLFQYIAQNQLLWKGALLLIAVFCLYWGILAMRRARTHKWDAVYFILLAASIFTWCVGSFGILFSAGQPVYFVFQAVRQIGAIFVPGLLTLHIWMQVSYKHIAWWHIFLCLFAPCVLVLFILTGQVGYTSYAAIAPGQGFVSTLFWFYFFAVLLKAVMLCLNVFYQMPRHMRRTTYYFLAALSLSFVSHLACMLLGNHFPYSIPLLTAGIMMFCLYDAFSLISSSSVVVTSRDFVFGSMSTMLLVLSSSRRILDWNKKTPAALGPLPLPQFRESFASYRNRIVTQGNGRVSSHGDNVITTTHNGKEIHFLLTIQRVQNTAHNLGYLVEIAEVTKIYSGLRYLEEIATIDQLTNLYNRNAYLTIVQQLMQQQTLPLVIVVGDVNNLKRMNDTQGHLVGDALLVTVASFIKEAALQGTYACRIGGDEFVLLMPGFTIADAKRFIETVNTKSTAIHGANYGTPSISWGYAVKTKSTQDYNDIFSQADQMMYSTKRARFRFTSSGILPRHPAPSTPPHAGNPDEINKDNTPLTTSSPPP